MTVEHLLIAASLELLSACENADEYLVADEIIEEAQRYRKLVDEYVVVLDD